jgi:hypothetical protein
VRDRHWVIRIEKGIEIAEATDNLVWEQTWRLVEGGPEIALDVVNRGLAPGLDAGDARGARYLPANRGAWTVFDLGEEWSLVAYRLTFVLGGWIPDALAVRFAMSELEGALRTIAENASIMPSVYDPEKFTIWGGDGRPIERLASDPATLHPPSGGG